MITVTVTPLDIERVSSVMLPGAFIAVGCDCVYRLNESDGPVEPLTCTDLDGITPLVELHVFATMGEARRWVEERERQRRLLHRAAGGRQ